MNKTIIQNRKMLSVFDLPNKSIEVEIDAMIIAMKSSGVSCYSESIAKVFKAKIISDLINEAINIGDSIAKSTYNAPISVLNGSVKVYMAKVIDDAITGYTDELKSQVEEAYANMDFHEIVMLDNLCGE